MSESVQLDPEALVRLREWGGEAMVGKMVELFLANTPQRMEQIRNGVVGKDSDLVERGAHSLKSTAANLGANELRDLAARLEEWAEAGETELLERGLPELERTYELTCEAVSAFRDGQATAP